MALSWLRRQLFLWLLFCQRPCGIRLSLTIRTCEDPSSRFGVNLDLPLGHNLNHLVLIFATTHFHIFHLIKLSLILVVNLLKRTYIMLERTIIRVFLFIFWQVASYVGRIHFSVNHKFIDITHIIFHPIRRHAVALFSSVPSVILQVRLRVS